MAVSILFNGVVYSIPDVGEESWGENLDAFFIAIPQGCLQKTGGTFTLTADTNFGANFGLLSKYFSTRSSNPASAGLVRLSVADTIAWRNNANDGNLLLAVDGSNRLTFNGSAIQPVGNYITALTGDVVATGPGSVAATIQAGVIVNSMVSASAAIAYSKLAALSDGNILVGSAGNVPTSVPMSGDVTILNTGATAIGANKVLDSMLRQSAGLSVIGRSANTTGNVADITAGTDGFVLRRSGTALGFALLVNANIDSAAAIAFSKLASLTSGNILVGSSGNVPTSVAMSGDVTIGNTGVTAIGTNKVTLAMMAQIATASFMGRTTASTGNVEVLTATQATALLNAMVGDSGSGGTKGLVPAPPSGSAAAAKYLKADGTWDTPAGAGTVTSVAMTVPTALFAASPVTGSPVTTSGTLAPTLATQTANTLFAGPSSGSAATPTFRAQVAADRPLNVVSKTTTYSVAATDDLILCSGSAFTNTLPPANVLRAPVRFMKTDSSLVSVITIARAGSDTIQGATATTINTQNEELVLVPDGSATWYVQSRNYPQVNVGYTPTFSAGWGTPTNVSIFSRRVGDSIYISGTFTCGTVAGSAGTITFGFNGTNNNVTSSTTAMSTTAYSLVGFFANNGSTVAPFTAIAQGNASTFALGVQGTGSSGLTPVNVNTLFANGALASFFLTIPIDGWKG